jgi:hypothetical protein
MEKRGEAYFDEWAEEIKFEVGGPTKERFAELRQHFDEILKGSRKLRQAFRQYLDGLRGVIAAAAKAEGQRLKAGGTPALSLQTSALPASTLTKVISDGRQAEETMNELLNTLSAAQTAVMSGPMPSPKSGGKP